MTSRILGISSMATRALLAELAPSHARRSGCRVEIVSVGGVDAARRVRAGEGFDLVVLASKVLDELASEGLVDAASLTGVARSGMGIAVRAGAPHPPLADEADLRAALLSAGRVAYSTGPSGDHLLRLCERLGIARDLAGRLVQARPGIPVATLLAAGDAELGVQQLSELVDQPGIALVGPLPPDSQSITVFTAGICRAARAVAEARVFLAALASPEADAAKRRHGLEPA